MKKKHVLAAYAVISLLLIIFGYILGIFVHFGFKFNNALTADGALNAGMTILGILAATILLPILIQPYLHKQNYVVTLANNDIDAMLLYIDRLIGVYTQIYESGDPITKPERQIILSEYGNLTSRAELLKKQAEKIGAFFDFDTEIYQKLISSRLDLADKGLPGQVLSERDFVDIKNALQGIANKLRSIRYDMQ